MCIRDSTYFVDVTDANNVLAGLTHIVANQSQPDPTGAIVLAAGQVYKNADFGYVQTPNTGKAIIGDTVWSVSYTHLTLPTSDLV